RPPGPRAATWPPRWASRSGNRPSPSSWPGRWCRPRRAPSSAPYTDFDDWKKAPERIPAGTPVAYTLKYHGTNLAVYIFRRDGVEHRGVTSLGVARRLHGVLVESATNLYWRAARAGDLFAKLDAYMRDAGLD